jgi:murein DD-endopeptidase MepM/ murein hydrolase activator NlpD
MRIHRRRRNTFVPVRSARRWPVTVGTGVSLLVAASLSAAILPAEPAFAGVLSNSWVWPVDAPRTVTREFRAPATEYSAGHRGIDIAVVEGQDVRSPDSGRVLFAGLVAGRGVITVDHGGGVVSSIEPVRAVVSVGDSVESGQRLGMVDFADVVWSDAHACACVHLGARYQGFYVSPRVLLERARPSVLKPWGDGPLSR